MKTLRRINLISIGRIYAVLGAIFGFIIMLIASVTAATLHAIPMMLPSLLGGVSLLLLPILGIILGAIFGGVFAIVGAAIYNVIAEAVGGIKFDISGKPMTVKQIGAGSYVKVFAIFALIAGLVLGILVTFALPSLTRARTFGLGHSVLGLVSGFTLVGLPILFLVLGIVYAAIYIILFNFFLKKVGGIVVGISGKPTALNYIKPWTYVRIAVIIAVIMTFVIDVFTLLGAGGGVAVALISLISSLISSIISTIIFGYIAIWIFNFVAARIGGVVIDLK